MATKYFDGKSRHECDSGQAGISALLKIDDVDMTVPFIMDSDLVSIQNT
jgi:hypothetical protein